MTTAERRFREARNRFSSVGVDVDAALARLARTPLSLPCWQGDDAVGFEGREGPLTGGVQVTGGYPGRARTPQELRRDLEAALGQIPGRNKVNLHAFYLESGEAGADRDQLEPEHFAGWARWAAAQGVGLDFNPSFFCHPKDAATLTSPDETVRRFWVEHGIRARETAAWLGRETGQVCTCCIWVPDGEKERPVDTQGPRRRLAQSLDEILDHPVSDGAHLIDAVESKLYGIGSEGYNAGTHEFYMAYLARRPGLYYTLDMGHFHPEEHISEKLSPCLSLADGLVLHLGRAVRWNSGHITTLDDETRAVLFEAVRLDALPRIHLALDYADASLNRVLGWVVGARCAKQALMEALLQPLDRLRALEREGRRGERLALLEGMKYMPYCDVWDQFCLEQGVPPGTDWLAPVLRYERDTLLRRT